MTAPPARRSVTVPSGWRRKPRDRPVLVVDDHVTFAEALASVLDGVPGLHAFAATTLEEARRLLAEREVGVVLLEVDLGGDDGIRFVRQALAENPDLRIVAVTASEDKNRVMAAVRAGVSGWVLKNEPVEHLVSVVRGALCGETRIPPRLLTHVLAELISAQRDATDLDQMLSTLTRREKEILDCLMRGMKTDDIARLLCLSTNTLRTHIRNIRGKLDVHSMLAAVALARRAEMAHPDSSATAGTRIRLKR